MRRLLRSPLAAIVVLVAAVAVGVLGLRSLGIMEALELAAYDWYLRLRPGHLAADSRILLVTVTDADIRTQGRWPLPDATLAEAVEALARHSPRAIGLDIYRDIPVPPGTETLEATLRRHENVVVVTKFGGGAAESISAPKVLAGSDRVGFNDIVVDPGGIVRRGLLFVDDGGTTASSFAFRLALLYLRVEGVTPKPDSVDASLLRLGPTTIRPLETNDGGYVGVDARGYQFLLDFHGGRGAFAAVSLTDLLAGRADPGLIRDRIVLFGVTAEGVKDFFYTPYSRSFTDAYHTPGIAVHAHIASQLLRMGLGATAPMKTATDWQEILWIVAWAGVGGAVGFVARSPWRFALGVGGGLVAVGAIDYGAFIGRWWLPLVPPAATWLVSAAVVTAYVTYHESAQRAALMQLFSRHVSHEVAEAIWRDREQFLDGGRPRPQRLTATVLFTDLVGWTSRSEHLEPQALVDWLNEYMDAMVQQVLDHGGIVNKYIGDAIMALFGVPVPRATDAEVARDAAAAVECALDMGTRLRELNREWMARGQPAATMRIGVFTGIVVAGSIGSARRLEYTVIGDTVNTASRLESFDKEFLAPDPAVNPCRILIGEPTRARLGERFETEWAGEVNLKGKERPLSVYLVRGRGAS